MVVDEWSPETGEMSPTLKLKRNVLAERYSHIIEQIYATTAGEHKNGMRIKIPRINLSLAELIRKLRNSNIFM
jgi:long-chain acyl-CoA synthetase